MASELLSLQRIFENSTKCIKILFDPDPFRTYSLKNLKTHKSSENGRLCREKSQLQEKNTNAENSGIGKEKRIRNISFYFRTYLKLFDSGNKTLIAISEMSTEVKQFSEDAQKNTP